MHRFLVPAFLVLTACTTSVTEQPERLAPASDLPPMKVFAAPRVTAPLRPNVAIAQDFLDLSFEMESGRPVPYMTRFDGPVTVRVVGNAPPSLSADLTALLSRLNREAGIDIRRVSADADANITIQPLPRDTLRKTVPQAACFVAPNVTDWTEYKRDRRSTNVDWTQLKTRTRAAIFLPVDVSPQEIRDCLHEELAQALGPLNDLYRLPDSIFNDDNFHSVLTGFDMLVLRAYYAPELQNGMTRAQVEARLPKLLARLNPNGEGRGGTMQEKTPRNWIDAMEQALGPDTATSQRQPAAQRAVQIAQARGWNDNRLAFSYFAVGRLSLSKDGADALAAFLKASDVYAATPGTEVQRAHLAMHLAAFALTAGQFNSTLEIVNANLNATAASENAALLASLLMIKAQALDGLGRAQEAQAVRLDSLGWARYGFGSDADVRARLREIAALSPRRNRI